MRYLPVLLLALAPLGAANATVSVMGNMGGTAGEVNCTSANSISYNLDQNVFSFFCVSSSLTYACTPDNVDYGTGTQAITLSCLADSGSAKGLVVDATMDGMQNGNGDADQRGICNNASAFQFHLTERRYTWTCNNGNGNEKTVSCWTSGVNSAFGLGSNEVDMDCVTVVWRSDFEDFEPDSSEYSEPHLE